MAVKDGALALLICWRITVETVGTGLSSVGPSSTTKVEGAGSAWGILPRSMQSSSAAPVDRGLALFCHLSLVIGVPLLGPLIVYLTQRRRSIFVARHALWAALIQVLTLAAAALVGGLIWLLFALGVVKASPGNLGLGVLPELLLAFTLGFGPLVIIHGVMIVVGSLWSLSGRPAGWPLGERR